MLFGIIDHEEFKSNIFQIRVYFQPKLLSFPGTPDEKVLEIFNIGVVGTITGWTEYTAGANLVLLLEWVPVNS